MRSILVFFLGILFGPALKAQLTITAGAQFNMAGNAQLCLDNISLVNHGDFNTNAGSVAFKGTANSSISGSQAVQFYDLQINKEAGTSVIMQRSIVVNNRLLFSSGHLNLNGHEASLGATGYLQGERNDSRITISAGGGGEVLRRAVLNAPSGASPGNMGVIFTSSQNMGTVIIRRGHQSRSNASGLGNSILRYYQITPENNTGLNATMRMHYFPNELNGIDESTLVMYKSDDSIHWLPQGFSVRNDNENFVEKTGINSFNMWTLSGAGNALPVQFSLFNVRCGNGKAIISWKTAQEQNASRFDVQRSMDGVNWTVAGSVTAAGNNLIERSYTYSDEQAVQNSYYRVAAYDKDGKIKYTSVLRSSCDAKETFRLWPNPAQKTVFINIVTPAASTAVIKLFDSKGALVKEHRKSILQGSNQISIDLGSLPAGLYSISAEWNNGQMKKTMQLQKH